MRPKTILVPLRFFLLAFDEAVPTTRITAPCRRHQISPFWT